MREKRREAEAESLIRQQTQHQSAVDFFVFLFVSVF